MTGSLSTALIPYTLPKTAEEFIRSEVEKGLKNGTIKPEQLAHRKERPRLFFRRWQRANEPELGIAGVFATIHLSPVNGHYPGFPRRRVFSHSGRKWCQDDVGRRLVRIFPVKIYNRFEWSFVPFSGSRESIESSAIKIINIKKDSIQYEDDCGLGSMGSEWNDSHWLSVEEFQKLIESADQLD